MVVVEAGQLADGRHEPGAGRERLGAEEGARSLANDTPIFNACSLVELLRRNHIGHALSMTACVFFVSLGPCSRAEKSKGRESMVGRPHERLNGFHSEEDHGLGSEGFGHRQHAHAHARPHRRARLRDRPRRVPPRQARPPGSGEHSHPAHRDRRGHQFPRQLLGLQRREERGPHGKGPPGRIPGESLPDDQNRRTDADGGHPADQGVAPTAPNGHHRPPAVPRDHPDGGSGSIFAEGGAIEAALEAKDAGRIRYVGFTGHKSPTIHLRMLETAANHGFRFDAVQMPLNVMDAHFESFEKKVLPVLVKEGIGVLGMKPLGDRQIPASNTVSPVEALHYAMNLPTSVVITGCDSMEILEQAVHAGRTFRPMSPKEVTALLAKTARAADDGAFERYKTTHEFDSTVAHPEWLR